MRSGLQIQIEEREGNGGGGGGGGEEGGNDEREYGEERELIDL